MTDPVDPRILQQQQQQQHGSQASQHQNPLLQQPLPPQFNQQRPESMDTSPSQHNLQNGQPHGSATGLPPTDVLLAQCMNMMAQVLQQQQVFQQASLVRQTTPPNPEAILDSLASNIKEFRFEADAGVTFDAWFARYDDLFEQDAARLDDAAKVRLLLRKLGIPEHDRYISSILPREPKHFGFADTVAKLKALFSIKESVVSRRYKCLQVSKSPAEDHVGYACRVNKLCVGFDIGKLSEDQFKCLVYVCGLKSEADVELRTRLLTRIEENANVSLEQLSEEAQRLLNLKHDSAMIEGPTSSVQAVKESRFNRPEQTPAHQPTNDLKKKPDYPCWFCGGLHFVRDCTFKNHECGDCGQVGHREGYCVSAKKSRRARKKRTDVNSNVVVINECSVQKRRKYVSVGIDGTQIRLQLDTASDITVIGKQLWKQVGSPALSPPTVNATTASGDALQLAGEFTCDITIADRTRRELIRVSERHLQLLGTDLVDSFSLWSMPMDTFCCHISGSTASVPELKVAFPDVFSPQLGLCSKMQVKMELKAQCKPVFCPKRPVAYAMYDAVDQELDRLEKLKIITPVDFSEWAAPIVVVRKANGTIRICGDYSTGLNSALQPHQYPLPLPEDIFAKLANCKVFSQIDLSDAFLQVEVHEQSRHLLTINTHRGLYHYNRLSPGVKIAPGAFQQITDTMMAGLQGTAVYMDDVVVGGKTVEEHDRNLRAVLQRIQDFGFTIRAEKCSFGQSEIRYLGHIVDSRGLRPDPGKIEAITKLSPPTDVSGVRSFLGAINFYGKFVPNMRMLRYPLDKLLKTDTKFEWTPECQRAFEQFKRLLSSDLLLTHYDPRQEIIVSADASSVGLGATICHRFSDGTIKVVQHASRALTKAEQNYSQPDREGLAVIFAVTKFHKMLFGRHFLLQTDHAPLLRIFGSKKGIPIYTANRLQRFALTLLLYDFGMEYVPTEKFGNADVLSRLINQHVRPDEDYVIASLTIEDDVRSVLMASLNVLPLTFRAVEQGTQSDPLLRQIFRYVKNEWPPTKSIEPEMKRFYANHESLCIVDGCLLLADRLVIPKQYQKRCLEQLHRGHPGIARMKAISRSFVYWPSLDHDIVHFVNACPHCASVARSPPHSPPVPWPKTAGPWQRVHIDFAGPVEGDHFLVVVDSFSKWPEIIRMRTISATATIAALRGLFARLGMPTLLVSDNGRQFSSAEFAEFCVNNGIVHLTTAPYHPQSNGQAERFVDTFKRSVKKIREGRTGLDEALDTFLLTYRSTPSHVLEGKSPAEVDEIAKRTFKRNDTVYVQVHARNAWRWAPGSVLERVGSVMYNVWVEERRLLRTHINQMRSRSDLWPALDRAPRNSCDQLPLDVLLDAWSLLKQQELALPSPSSASAPSSSTLADTPVEEPHCRWSPSRRASSTPRREPSPEPEREASSQASPELSSSSSTTLTPFNSSGATSESVVPQPRRSSRTRRAPQWFDPYHLY